MMLPVLVVVGFALAQEPAPTPVVVETPTAATAAVPQPISVRIEAGAADAETLQRALRDALDPESVAIEVADPTTASTPADIVIVARPPAAMVVAVADPKLGLTTREIPIGDAVTEVAAEEAAQIAEAVVAARASAPPEPAPEPTPPPEPEPVVAPAPAPPPALPRPPAEPEPVFDRGAYLGFSPSVGGFTVLSERRSGLSLGFQFEAGYLFARFTNRPKLRVGLGAGLFDDNGFLYADRSSRTDVLAILRIGTEWRRTFAYALVGAGPSVWNVRDDVTGDSTRLQATGKVGAGIVWRLNGKLALGVEGDVAASGSEPSDAQLRWSGRVVLMRYFGGRGSKRGKKKR